VAQALVPVFMGPAAHQMHHESPAVGQARSLRRPRRPPGCIFSSLREAFDAAALTLLSVQASEARPGVVALTLVLPAVAVH
jgi:hypothetical protein